jgi:hypothetical protein
MAWMSRVCWRRIAADMIWADQAGNSGFAVVEADTDDPAIPF